MEPPSPGAPPPHCAQDALELGERHQPPLRAPAAASLARPMGACCGLPGPLLVLATSRQHPGQLAAVSQEPLPHSSPQPRVGGGLSHTHCRFSRWHSGSRRPSHSSCRPSSSSGLLLSCSSRRVGKERSTPGRTPQPALVRQQFWRLEYNQAGHQHGPRQLRPILYPREPTKHSPIRGPGIWGLLRAQWGCSRHCEVQRKPGRALRNDRRGCGTTTPHGEPGASAEAGRAPSAPGLSKQVRT